MKQTYKIIAIAAVIVLVILGIYFLIRAVTGGPEETPPETVEEGEDGRLPTVGERGEDGEEREPGVIKAAKLKKISDDGARVFDFWLNSRTGEVFYIAGDGKIFGTKEGPDPEISSQPILALNYIEVEPEERQVLAAFGDPKSPSWGIFDALDKVWRPLPSTIINVTWGKNDEELIGVVRDDNKFSLARINLAEALAESQTFKFETLVDDFRMRDVRLSWIPPNHLIIAEKTAFFYSPRTWRFDLESLEINLMEDNTERGSTARWIRDENMVLKFIPPGSFFMFDHGLGNALLSVFTTFPDKCAVTEENIYCFAPQSFLPDIPNLKLPDDYFQNRFFTTDDLFLMERETLETTRVMRSGQDGFIAIDAKNPRYAMGKLYFINRYDNALYELAL